MGRPETEKEVATDWAGRHLRIANSSYDEVIRRFIPNYGEMISRAATEVARVRPRLVTDLGSGTGSLAEALLAEEGVGAVELVDSDDSMLDRAEERLARFGDRVRLSCRDFNDPPQESDAFCASLALHHIADLEDKRAFYRNIFVNTPEGGVFVNADIALSSSEDENRRIRHLWVEHMVSAGIHREQVFRHFEEWAEEDTYFTLDEELDAIGRAGFRAECVWRIGMSAICVGRK
ncbi:MAG: methyltransferase domain-containing protein [Gemmatimonadetes bacterium]|nr:methyltransferase domain-containing protein [Gemmatimonadota bacterium]